MFRLLNFVNNRNNHAASETSTAAIHSTELSIRLNTAAPDGTTVKSLGGVCVQQRGSTRQPGECTMLIVRATMPQCDIPVQCYQSDRVFLVTDPQRRGDTGDHVNWTDLLTELVTKHLVMVCACVLTVTYLFHFHSLGLAFLGDLTNW